MVIHNIKVEEPLSLNVLTTKLTYIQPFAITLLADTTLLSLFTTNTLPYTRTNSILGLQALFFIVGPRGCPETWVKNYH